MAENLCVKMGDTNSIERETVLWINDDVTVEFPAKVINLIDYSSYDFDKIRIYYNGSTTNDFNASIYIDIPKSEFAESATPSGLRPAIIYFRYDSSHSFARSVNIEEKAITFNHCFARHDTSDHDTACIPTKITGISKKTITLPSYKDGKEVVTVLWSNPSPSASMASSSTITLSNGLENYDYLRIMWKASTSDTINSESFADWYIGKNPAALVTEANNEKAVIGAAVGTDNYIYVRTVRPNIPSGSSSYTELILGNAGRIGNTATNTNYVIPLVVYGINYKQQSEERISSTFTVLPENWSNSTVSFNGKNCYTMEFSNIESDGFGPITSIASSSDIITIEEQEAYNKIDYISVDTENKILKLYAETKPTISFTILVKGIKKN